MNGLKMAPSALFSLFIRAVNPRRCWNADSCAHDASEVAVWFQKPRSYSWPLTLEPWVTITPCLNVIYGLKAECSVHVQGPLFERNTGSTGSIEVGAPAAGTLGPLMLTYRQSPQKNLLWPWIPLLVINHFAVRMSFCPCTGRGVGGGPSVSPPAFFTSCL